MSGYTPLPSEPAYEPPPAYAATADSAYKGPTAAYPAHPAAYPGSYQGGAPYAPYPATTAQQPTTYTHVYQSAPSVVVIGGCPACRVGVLEDEYSCLGIFCAIVFFPLGILCCLAMKQRHCPNCGAIFG